MRWVALLWLAVWIPSNFLVWGPPNFLLLCDIAVVLTGIGLWTNSSLLLSSQAVSSLFVDSMWCLDAVWRALLHKHLIGGTEYMWDSHFGSACSRYSTCSCRRC